MTINISFGGATIKRPGAYSQVDSASMTVVQLGALKTLAVVGTVGATATVTPGAVAYFNDPKAASDALGDCDMLEVMKVAWRHGADLIAVSAASVTAPSTEPTDQEWQSAIDALTTEFVSGIIPVTTTSAIIAKVDTHVTTLSSTKNRKRRRGFYGHATGLDATAVAALTSTLTSERGVLASPCPLVADSTGTKTAKPGYYMAAAFAGIWASQPEQEPITYKTVKFDGLEKIYTGDEIESLLGAHVAPVEVVKNVGFRIVQGLTLDSTTDLTKNELSVSTLKDAMDDNVESYFEGKYIGKAGVAGIEVTIYNDLVSILEGFVSKGWISGYVPESVKVTKVGTAFTLEWEGKPTLPINNFLNTVHLTLN